MAVQAAIPLAGKLLPLLQGITSNPAMAARITGAAAGGLPSLLSGDIPGAVLGGSFGALSTLGLGGLGQRFANPLATGAAGLLGNQGMKSVLAANVARAALPLGIGLSANAILGRGERNLASQAMGVGGGGINNAAGIIGYNAVSGEPIVGPAVPGGMGQFGGIPPYGGSALDVLQPGGPAGAQRITTLKNALVGADVKDNDPFGRFLGGFADLILQDITDFDKKGNIRGEEHTKGLRPGSGYGKEWDQEKESKLVEEKRKADIASGRSLPSLEEAAESEQYKDFVFNRERERYNQVIQDQLAYAIENNPKLARAMLPVLTEARRTSEGMPSSIQARMYLSALGAKAGGDRISKMVDSATTAAQSGLGRYSGIRVS
jgi:hypothetical protein